ncbi:hypothetical protein GOP47_0017506 [Adiantum capillus-veneris]|uniref:Probable purine permease n=1 Tax=Adiantum capillus-veneris TaxID=13818 RepID=A0A9D4UGD1_ADICA|nr:hypothetical protein GOP47_0017506 [Adiantum capillus-veneris]
MDAALEQISIDKQMQINSQVAVLVDDAQGNGCFKPSEEQRSCAKELSSPTVNFFGKPRSYWVLMIASSIALVVGLSSASLLGRFYFVNGGSRRWVYTWIESTGWPVLLLPLFVCYSKKNCCVRTALKQAFTPRLCLIYVAMGFLTAFDNLLYSMGLSYLPVSTNSLVCSSQLAFNAVFAYVLVGQKLSPFAINSVVVISTGTVLLGVSAENDRPSGTTQREYIIGVLVTIVASAIYALMLPLLQLIYTKGFSKEKSSFVIVLEVQIAISSVASIFSLLGMFVHGDLHAIREEALLFHSGLASYILTLLFSAIGWQLYFLGSAGIIFLSSSLMSCVFMTAMIPILPILAVIFFHDNFSALKGIAMLLSTWGFVSYIYDGYMVYKSQQKTSECEGS